MPDHLRWKVFEPTLLSSKSETLGIPDQPDFLFVQLHIPTLEGMPRLRPNLATWVTLHSHTFSQDVAPICHILCCFQLSLSKLNVQILSAPLGTRNAYHASIAFTHAAPGDAADDGKLATGARRFQRIFSYRGEFLGWILDGNSCIFQQVRKSKWCLATQKHTSDLCCDGLATYQEQVFGFPS